MTHNKSGEVRSDDRPCFQQTPAVDRMHLLALAATVAVGALVSVFCAIRFIGERGLMSGGGCAVLATVLAAAVPLLCWRLLPRIAASTPSNQSDQGSPRSLLSYLLLVASLAIAGAAVWVGEGYARSGRPAIEALMAKGMPKNDLSGLVQPITVYFRLVAAGMLLQVSVATVMLADVCGRRNPPTAS